MQMDKANISLSAAGGILVVVIAALWRTWSWAGEEHKDITESTQKLKETLATLVVVQTQAKEERERAHVTNEKTEEKLDEIREIVIRLETKVDRR